LRTLIISGNKIERIENLSNLENLGRIDISENPVKSFSGIENLPSIYCISSLKVRDYNWTQIKEFEEYFERLRLQAHFYGNEVDIYKTKV